MYMSLRARVAGLIKQPGWNYRPSQRMAHTVNVLIDESEGEMEGWREDTE